MARLDGCLDFLVLTGPTGNTQVAQSVTENSPVNRSSPRNKKKNNHESCVGVKGSSPTVIIACHLIQRVRAHLKPVSFLRVSGGRVITGSQDRTIKVRLICQVNKTTWLASPPDYWKSLKPIFLFYIFFVNTFEFLPVKIIWVQVLYKYYFALWTLLL